MGENLRIFISTSGLSALYQSIYAKNTRGLHDRDLFIIDALALKPSQKEPILQAIQHHRFDWVVDMSFSLEESASQVPSLKKRLTRKLKILPGFKQVYDFLYEKQQAGQGNQLLQTLIGKNAQAFELSYQNVQLHTQPAVKLNDSILQKYPKAEIRYFEHGLGDYLDVESKIKEGITFHCVFDRELAAFRKKKGLPYDFVAPVVGEEGFLQKDIKLETYFPEINNITIPSEKPLILIATQALKQFEVSDDFWITFMDLCLEKIAHPEKFTFLIKPHPRQEKEVLDKIAEYLNSKELDVVMWDSPDLKGLHMEVIFRRLHAQVQYVFSPFSSAVFYLSRLYPGQQIQYFFGLNPLFEFTGNSPQMYVNRWKELYPLLKEVFGSHVSELG